MLSTKQLPNSVDDVFTQEHHLTETCAIALLNQILEGISKPPSSKQIDKQL